MAEDGICSVRSVYRYFAALCAAGVSIESEPGATYRLREAEIPPLAFSRGEVEALVLGAGLVRARADADIAAAAGAALAKAGSALPAELGKAMNDAALLSPPPPSATPIRVSVAKVGRTSEWPRRVAIDYRDSLGAGGRRTVCPIGVLVPAPVWPLAAWCELRGDYRAFWPTGPRQRSRVRDGSSKAGVPPGGVPSPVVVD